MIVAEAVTRRFFNVIQILGHSVPLIAIQANIVEANDHRCLHFTKILDIDEEPTDELPDEPAKREDWLKKAPATLEAADALEKLLGLMCKIDTLAYKQSYISMPKNNHVYFWFEPGTKMPRLLFRVTDDAKEEATTLLTKAGLLPEVNPHRIRVPIDKKAIEANTDALKRIAQLVLAYHE